MPERPYQIACGDRTLFVASEIGEDLLGAAFLRMKQEGLLDMMFWLKAPTLREFLDWACARRDVVVIGGFVQDGPSVQLAGLGWVREVTERNGQKFADVGELFFREFQSMAVTRPLASLMLDFAFEQVGVQSLYGLTPRPNAAALRFMRGLGFSHTVEVPYMAAWMGENCPAVISWMTREQWEAGKDSGKEAPKDGARGGGEIEPAA